MQTTATETTNDLRHGFTVLKGKEKTVIKIRLNDECGNGHEDFSLTADIYEKKGNGQWCDVGGGCCHDHILALRPDLKPFADLHLSTWQGVPMHAFSNAFYWFAGFVPEVAALVEYHGGSGSDGKPAEECRRIFADMIRATPDQVAAIVAQLPRTEKELQAVLEDQQFPQQWQGEASAAIARLEEWTGKQFESKATRGHWKPLAVEHRALIAERRASGYYSPEQTAARDAAKFAAAKEKKLAEIRKDAAKSIEKINRDAQVHTYIVARYFPNFRNFIYYDHTNKIAVNWSTTEKLITREEFDKIVAEADLSALPEGIQFEWQPRPKY
jgi:hypothetical protein